jgi:hypothetical protein
MLNESTFRILDFLSGRYFLNFDDLMPSLLVPLQIVNHLLGNTLLDDFLGDNCLNYRHTLFFHHCDAISVNLITNISCSEENEYCGQGYECTYSSIHSGFVQRSKVT